ncbi:zinc metalloprotease [Elasticomyces elasticus]|nr:zinc metalloprotease [Elasticomyces elasticus]
MDLLNRLGRWLDRPLFPWKSLIVSFQIGQYFFESYLSYRQYQVLQRNTVPKQLEKEIDQKTFDKSQDYGRAKTRFGFLSGIFSQAKSLAVIYYDVYPKLWSLTGLVLARYFPSYLQSEIPHSLLFIFTYSFVETLLGLPFSYYYHFVLEQHYGFNKQTVKLWVTDVLKGQALGLAFGIPLGWAFLRIIQKTGDTFFYFLWLFTFVVQLFAITIYPIFIVPLFNKLTPLPPGQLKDGVEALAAKLKFPLGELQVIDGSKRSAHSNAYFTGLPWKKKIVIYDTLIEKSSPKEVEAILAHELGHWSLSHTTRLLVIPQIHIFYIFALFSVFIKNGSLYDAFGFTNERPIMIGFLLFNEVLAPTDAVIKLIMNVWTRKMEFEADAFSARLGYATELASSLIKLQVQNLSSMDADYWYSTYHHSHPILTERLKAIGWKSDKAGAAPVDRKTADGDVSVKTADREL